ncbi:MAG: amidohydrolase [Thermodesulfobacteriota bacterium]
MSSFDLLVKNGLVVTMDRDMTILENGYVGITGSSIAVVGKTNGQPLPTAKKELDAAGGIIMPGLVNAHTHASMTLFRGLADDLPLMDWLQNHIFPAEARLTREMVYQGALLACAEMILSGTTSFCDMYLFEDAVAQAADESGMRALVGEVLYDFDSPHYGPIDKGFAFTEELLARYQGHSRVSIAVEPHSPYLCAPELLTRVTETASRWNAPVVIHVSETESEVSQMRQKFGKTPVAHLENLGFFAPHVIADHCVAIDENDIEILARRNVKVAINPESNMKLASGNAPVPALLSAGVCVALGTDGCASNNNLDMFGEMDTAAKIHKVQSMDPTVMDAATVLRLATRGGASALGVPAGELSPGKRADLIVINTNQPHLTPLYHPASHLVYAARGADVTSSVIDGRVVMEDRQVLTLDVNKVMADVRALAEKLR